MIVSKRLEKTRRGQIRAKRPYEVQKSKRVSKGQESFKRPWEMIDQKSELMICLKFYKPTFSFSASVSNIFKPKTKASFRISNAQLCHRLSWGHQQVLENNLESAQAAWSLLIEITYQRGIPDTSFTCLHLTGITFKQQNRRKTTEFQYDIQSRKMTSRLRQLVDNFTAGKRFK